MMTVPVALFFSYPPPPAAKLAGKLFVFDCPADEAGQRARLRDCFDCIMGDIELLASDEDSWPYPIDESGFHCDHPNMREAVERLKACSTGVCMTVRPAGNVWDLAWHFMDHEEVRDLATAWADAMTPPPEFFPPPVLH